MRRTRRAKISGKVAIEEARVLDALIIGEGPAGLTAAIYLARFPEIIQTGRCRRAKTPLIPVSHSHAGFPNGISGNLLFSRMREQVLKFGAQSIQGDIQSIERDGANFVAVIAGGTITSRTVVRARLE